MADRVVVMNGGRVEQVGAPIEIYDRPANEFVARFIGSPVMNFFEGTLETGASGPAVNSGSVTVPVLVEKLQSGRKVWLGIRPEHIELNAAPGQAVCEVSFIEPLGRETLVYGRVDETDVCIAPSRRAEFGPGDTVPLGLPAEHLHVFDRETGLRL